MVYEQEAYLLKEEKTVIWFLLIAVHASHQTVWIFKKNSYRSFIETMAEMGVETEQMSSEFGPGQVEINMEYNNCLKATDDQVTFKQLFKHLARDMGMVGTLAPKPFNDLAGSGLHVHISLFEGEKNLFKDINDGSGLDLSETAYHFMGGIFIMVKHYQRSVLRQ